MMIARFAWKTGVPKRTLDGYSVTPRNHATAALYTYTPWAGSAQQVVGNYLHWRLWQQLAPRAQGPQPPLPLGASCSRDEQCSGGKRATGRVCGASSRVCIEACHDDDDCPSSERCDQTLPTWRCRAR